MRVKAAYINSAVALCSIFFALELAGFLSGYWMPQLYDDTYKIIDRLKQKDGAARFQAFLKGRYSPVIGINPVTAPTYADRNSLEENILYTQDRYGARLYKGYDHEKAQVLLIGDSYTYGHEITDDDTIAANMYRQTGKIVANLGVPGSDPLKAFLALQSQKSDYPHARVVVMGIDYDDINRMLDHWRVTLWPQSGWPFALLPYVKNGVYHAQDASESASYETVIPAIERAAKTDYWAKPRHQFPYSFALIKGLFSHAYYFNYLGPALHSGYKQYELQYRDPELGQDLASVLSMFIRWAAKERVIPVVMFIPSSQRDTTSANYWIERYQVKLPLPLIMHNLDFSAISPERFNLQPWAGRHDAAQPAPGHPSPYGAAQIALQYNLAVQEALKIAPRP